MKYYEQIVEVDRIARAMEKAALGKHTCFLLDRLHTSSSSTICNLRVGSHAFAGGGAKGFLVLIFIVHVRDV